MRILLLSEFYRPIVGGLELHVEALRDGLTHRGHEVLVGTLATPRAQRSEDGVERMPSTTRALNLSSDPGRPFALPFRDPVLTFAIERLIRRFQPDIIHAHNWVVASVPRDRSAPLILTLHDYFLTCAKRTLVDRSQTPCLGPKGRNCSRCAREQYGSRRSLIISAATKVSRSRIRPEAVIAVSEAVAASLRGYVDWRVVVIPPGVRPVIGGGAVSGALRTRLPGRPFVMYAGAPDPHKGVDLLLDVWARSLVKAPLFMALTRPVAVTLPSRVTAGSLSRDDVVRAFGAARVAVAPSIWPEPFGSVAAEALLAGTPVVASNLGGLREIVSNGGNGVLVEPNSTQALVAALGRLLTDEQYWRKLKDGAMADRGRFAMDIVIAKIENLYGDVLAKPRTVSL